MSVRQMTVEVRDNYGKLAMYPDCSHSRVFAELLGQATLTTRDLVLIERLGYELSYTGKQSARAMEAVADNASRMGA